MDEASARERVIQDFNVSRETLEALETFTAFLADENERQNLVSRGTLASVWERHVLDSAQLLRFAPAAHASWLDLGTGAGFPGLIVGLLHQGPVVMIEERKKRVEFLHRAAEILRIADKVEIYCSRVERIDSLPFDVISARAFAPLEKLFDLTHSFSTAKTRWILPKGRNAASELEAAKSSWQGDFRLEQSITDADAQIIVAEGVSPKAGGQKRQGKGAR
jgi:16S rRNA (guanine527-N7)-methyltransferase